MVDVGAVPVRLRYYGGQDARSTLESVTQVYADVFAEPPYCEDANQVDVFTARINSALDSPGFSLITADVHDEVLGFTFGHQLVNGHPWLDDLCKTLPAHVTQGWEDGATYAVVELAVRPVWRRQGVAGALYQTLLANRSERRGVLLVRPDATAAVAAYSHWGWEVAGHLQPGEDAPVYRVLTRSLPP